MRKNRLQKIAALYEKHRPNQTEEDKEAIKLFYEVNTILLFFSLVTLSSIL